MKYIDWLKERHQARMAKLKDKLKRDGENLKIKIEQLNKRG